MIAAFRVLVAVGLAGALTFVIMYATITRSWFRSNVGRHLMAEAFVLAGLLALTLSSALWHVPAVVWVAGLLALDVVLWLQVWLLWRANMNSGRST